MERKVLRLTFSSDVSAMTEVNSSFDKGVLRVAYTGKNRNGSSISKEVFERCIRTIYNCPIVCNYDRDTDEIGAHDMEVVTDSDGNMKLVNMTNPVGVVPQGAQYWWSVIDDDSGRHEYLCVEVLLWKRQEAYQKIKENGVTDESMEITVLDGAMVDGVYVIKDFEFTAFCLLGTAEPCFESAALETFSCSTFKTQFQEMMDDFHKSFSLAPSPDGAVAHKSKEGGDEKLEDKVNMAAEYGFKIDELDFFVDDLTLDELRAKFEEMKTKETEPEGAPDNFALESVFCEELRNSVMSEKVDTPWGADYRYYVWDYDKGASEVYVQDTADWKLYGFTYSMDGDRVVINYDSKKRMKIAIEPFDEGENGDQLPEAFSRIVENFNKMKETLQSQHQSEMDTLESELDSLRSFKANVEQVEEKAKRDEVFAKFEDLNGVEAFEALKNENSEFSIDALEEKCFAIRGRQKPMLKFTKEVKQPKLAVERKSHGSTEPEPYGGLFEKYNIARED